MVQFNALSDREVAVRTAAKKISKKSIDIVTELIDPQYNREFYETMIDPVEQKFVETLTMSARKYLKWRMWF